MPGDGHDGKVVVAGEAQIVYGTVAQVVEGKVTQSCLLYSTAPLLFLRELISDMGCPKYIRWSSFSFAWPI